LKDFQLKRRRSYTEIRTYEKWKKETGLDTCTGSSIF
jgi:hypothetical protein